MPVGPASLYQQLGIVGLVLVVYWIVAVVAIIGEDREPTITLAWILTLVAFPGIGLVFYFFLGRDWKHRIPKRAITKTAHAEMREAMLSVYEPYLQLQADFMSRFEGTVTGRISHSILAVNDDRPLPVRSFDILPSGEEFFSALLTDMAGAQRFIHLQFYIWEHDELTKRIAMVLHDRLNAGVEVRINYDWIGSLPFRKDQLHALRDAGAVVRADTTAIGSINYRNHRKIVVIDAEIGYTGGHNIGQEYIDGGSNYDSWRDTSARITGPGVAALQKWFAHRWLIGQGDSSMFAAKYFPEPDPALAADEPIVVQVVAQGVDDPMESARRAHMVAISGAEKTVRLQSPYFVPDAGMYDAMINAALAGIDVRFMMTGVPDHIWAFWAAQSYWRQLIVAGVRVYVYEAGFFHAKTIAVDSEACAIGTLNLDLRSLRLQREIMLWTFHAPTVREQEAIFDRDLDACREITLVELDSMNRLVRLRNSAARLAANLL